MVTIHRGQIRQRLLIGALLIGAAGVLATFSGRASAAPEAQAGVEQRPHVTVIGEGEARAEPDMAAVTVGVTVTAPSAAEAMDEVSRRLADVIASARAHGVADQDIQTTGLSVQPILRRGPRPEDPPQVEAYRAANNVALTIRDLARASAALQATIDSGANVVGPLHFGVSNVEPVRLAALDSAARNAAAKARTLAAAAGVGITGVISIVEEGIAVPRPQADLARVAPAAEAVAVPVEPGELVLHARVRISYSI